MGAPGCSWWLDNNEQSGKAEKQAEHAQRQNTAILESAHEETKTSPVKANVEWEISHKNPTTQKSARKTKKPKSPQSDKKPKQTKVPSQKRATTAPDSSSSEEMGDPDAVGGRITTSKAEKPKSKRNMHIDRTPLYLSLRMKKQRHPQ